MKKKTLITLALSLMLIGACGGDNETDQSSSGSTQQPVGVPNSENLEPTVVLQPSPLKEFRVTLTGCNRFNGLDIFFGDIKLAYHALGGTISDQTAISWKPASIGIPESGTRSISTEIDKCAYAHSAVPFLKEITCSNVIFGPEETISFHLYNDSQNTLLGCKLDIQKKSSETPSTWTTLRQFSIDLNGVSGRDLEFIPMENEVKVIEDQIYN